MKILFLIHVLYIYLDYLSNIFNTNYVLYEFLIKSFCIEVPVLMVTNITG